MKNINFFFDFLKTEIKGVYASNGRFKGHLEPYRIDGKSSWFRSQIKDDFTIILARTGKSKEQRTWIRESISSIEKARGSTWKKTKGAKQRERSHRINITMHNP